MGKLLFFLSRMLAVVLIADYRQSDVKIQFRTPNDVGWQDHGCIRGNRESIDHGLLARAAHIRMPMSERSTAAEV
jgi:hypothetical protein